MYARFTSVLDSLLATGDSRLTTPLAVALSGGADSTALALLTQEYAQAKGCTLITFTVDHRLRAESTAEAQQVSAWMRARGIAHHILTPEHSRATNNLQHAARQWRYDALAEACTSHGCSHLLVAHHADDQAETVALQRHRGEGSPSHAGMAAVRFHGTLAVLRPLLGTRKRSLIAYLEAQDQPWVEDPSNESDAYARNRLRLELSEQQIVTLWHHAQAAGEQRHREEATRNAWFSAHAQCEAARLTFSRAAWLALEETPRMDYLSHTIRCIGGKPFRPRMHETKRLCNQLEAVAQSVATLGHCRIEAKDGSITIRPEHAGLDGAADAAHIQSALVKPPFWWFNSPLES